MSNPLPDELPPNFDFGGYVIHACIGRGGMARVYRAEQAALQRPVALKVLDRWVLEQPQGSQRFLREARAAASIKHQNVVDIVDIGVWQERPYIVMELLSGTDLETHLARHGVLSDSAVAELALPIIAGMMAVHDAGVVHRDLKPSNIFLANGPDDEIIPKVLDFGVSKFNDALQEPAKRQTKTREIIGTPTYMAPEALNGVRELGPRADQYALGAVLYECCTGRPPFEGETLLELLKAIAVGNVPSPRSIRPELSITLEDALMRAMNADPRSRFETLRDFGRALWPLADERSRTIWARSFGNGRSATLGSGETAGLVLVANQRMFEPPPPSKHAWPLHKLAWMGLFLIAGALATGVVLGPWRAPEAGVRHEPDAPVAAAATEPQRLLAEGSAATASAALSERVEGEPQSPPHDEPRARSSAAAKPMAKAHSTTASSVNAALRSLRPASVTPPRRKRAPRTEPREVPSTASELDGLFASPAAPGAAASAPDRRAGNSGELEGLFPSEELVGVGANGAPLLD